MTVRTGCDILCLQKFTSSLQQEAKNQFLSRIFTNAELDQHLSPESLGGVFCAKEAVRKALDISIPLTDIEILTHASGCPYLQLPSSIQTQYSIQSSDISISHHEQYAMATAIFLLEHPL